MAEQVINESTYNFNTPEAKISKEVSQQFVASRTGKVMKNTVLRKETQIILKRVAEMELKQKSDHLRSIVNGSHISEDNGLKHFLLISEHIFDGQENWGRVLSLFLYGALLLDQLKKTGNERLNDKVALWLSICLARQSAWIRDSGNGWDGFVTTMGGPKEEIQERVFNGLFNMTLGLGTIAAVLYIQGH